MHYIDSPQNNRVKNFAKLKEKKYREEMKCFLIEGEHLIEEALKEDLVQVLFTLHGTHSFDLNENIEVIQASEAVMAKLSSTSSAAEYVAVCKYMPHEIGKGNRVIALDNVQDPGNVGTIIRSALSFGFSGIVLSKNGVDIYNEKLIRSTQGAIFHFPIIRCDIVSKLQELKEQGYYLVGTSLQNGKGLELIGEREKMVLIVGNEGSGVSQEVLDLTDVNAFIEMVNFESLNVGVAAGIMMYKFRGNK